jgi:hypothetical protein
MVVFKIADKFLLVSIFFRSLPTDNRLREHHSRLVKRAENEPFDEAKEVER